MLYKRLHGLVEELCDENKRSHLVFHVLLNYIIISF